MPQDHSVLTIVIAAGAADHRLDKALAMSAPVEAALSRARLQALLEQGQVGFAGKPVANARRKAQEGESYLVHLPPPEAAKPEAQAMPLKVAYEDKDLLVIDKPAGVVVHPAPGNRDGTLVNALLAHCGKSLSGIGGVARPGIVHRLDKDTSGLLVVAKNDKAHHALTEQFADRSLSRTYLALVWGHPHPLAGSIEGNIGRHPKDRKKMAVMARGKQARTHYKVLETFEQASLLECKLETGRTHQIRVHLAHRKWPVVGDPVYGRNKVSAKDKIAVRLQDFPRQALHAAEIQFKHPRTGKPMRFGAKVPGDMQALLKALRAGK